MDYLGDHQKIKLLDRGGSITKKKILEEATRLFALNGFDSVSIRDIAQAVGIQSASIYAHFNGKGDLMERILENAKLLFADYLERLAQANASSDTVEAMLDNLFYEFHEVEDVFMYYGISFIQMEKYHKESARDLYFKLFHEMSIDSIQRDFDRLVEQGKALPFDTRAVATILTHCLLVSNELRIHEHLGNTPPVRPKEMFLSLKYFLAGVIQQGVPVAD